LKKRAPKQSQAVEKADMLRRYRLITAFDAKEVVTVDGVQLNLACNVDKTIWRPLCPLGLYGSAAALRGPEIVFPWTPTSWRKSFAKDGELVEAKRGSLVFIGQVMSLKLDTAFGDFSHPEEREAKLAYLFVKDGNQISGVKRPLILLAEEATAHLIELRDYSKAYSGMISKLEQAIGLDDIEDLVGKPISEWPTIRGNVQPGYARAYIAFVEASTKWDEEAFAAFGYMMARAEAESMLLELAIRGRAAKLYQAKAADGRRAKSRLATDPLREIAHQIIRTNGDISLSRCARLVADKISQQPDWTQNTEPKWISGHIKELFERRGPRMEYRPKREAP